MVDVLNAALLGVWPIDGREPIWLCDRPRAGVGARVGCFLSGDSGRGRDGLFGLKFGLGGLAPGPTDCENLGLIAGVAKLAVPFTFSPLYVLREGVAGVPACSEDVGDNRRSARRTGRKIPAPAIEVWK